MKHKIAVIFMSVLISLTNLSCKYALVPEPTNHDISVKNPADYDDYIVAPIIDEISQGDFRKVSISWSPLPNAVRYYIYSAPTPFDNFEKKGECSDTNFTLEEDFSIIKYYAVQAVNYYGTLSPLSEFFSGSTLAKPLITSIDRDSSGTEITINWWMGNCNSETYQDKIQYEILCYADENKNQLIKSKTVSNNELKCTIENLSPNTDYYFLVKATNTKYKVSEISDLTNQSTAHKIIPDEAINFTVDHGTNKDFINISWELPDFVDFYNSKSYLYEKRPVYFTLQRKISNQDDSSYTTIANYIGIAPEAKENYYYFNSTNNSSNNNDILSISCTDKENIANINYPSYIPGTKLTFKDVNIERGIQYTYRIQSFTDFAENKIFCSSIKEEQAWSLSIPSLKVTSKFNETETEITNTQSNFKIGFNNYDQDYTYILSYIKTDIKTMEADSEKILKTASSINEINAFTLNLDATDAKLHGYYKFYLYILEKTQNITNSIPDKFLDRTEGIGTLTVTNDKSHIPEITYFNIEDAYKDHFVISWKVNKLSENTTYQLNWIPFINNVPQNPESCFIAPEDIKFDSQNNIYTYTHKANSGDTRQYSLTINSLLSVTVSADNKSETLGTVKAQVTDIDYENIYVQWEPVQKALDTYQIKAYYTDNPTKPIIDFNTQSDNLELNYNPNSNKVYCTIKKPDGYNNAQISGKEIKFLVKAKSISTEDETISEALNVRTLGPALINLKKDVGIYKNSINISWVADTDAKAYIIHRVLKDTNNSYSDTYLFDVEKNELKEKDGQSISGRAEIKKSNGNIYTLLDKQKDAEENYGYHKNQEKIQWGLEYSYTVIPLKDLDSATYFKFEEASNQLSEESPILYSNLKEISASTNGYGLNVKASKAESAEKVNLTWDEPYIKNQSPSIFRRKYVYTSNGDVTSTNSIWELVEENIAPGTTSYDINIKNEDWGNAYEYAVQYIVGSANFVKSYEKKLAVTMEDRYNYDGKNPETANKGYVLAIEDFKADYNGKGTEIGNATYYQECISWLNWDYNLRSLGPDSLKFKIKNKNLSYTQNWLSIAESTIDSNNNFQINTMDDYAEVYDTEINKIPGANKITLNPVSIKTSNAGATNGLLKVMRDARHYYAIELERKDSKTSKTYNTLQANNESIYAYRQITPEELTKSVMLIVADSFNGTSKTKNTSQTYIVYTEYKHETPGKTGSFMWKNGYDQISFYYDAYEHIFESTPTEKEIISPFILSKCNYQEVGTWNNNKDYKLRVISNSKEGSVSEKSMVSIEISPSSDNKLSSYYGKLYFASSDSTFVFRLVKKQDNTETELLSKKIDDRNNVKFWNPMHIASNAYSGEDENFNWWN